MKEILAILRPETLQESLAILLEKGVDSIAVYDALGRGREAGRTSETERGDEALSRVPFLKKRMISFTCADRKVEEFLRILVEANQTGRVGDGKIFVSPIEVMK